MNKENVMTVINKYRYSYDDIYLFDVNGYRIVYSYNCRLNDFYSRLTVKKYYSADNNLIILVNESF